MKKRKKHYTPNRWNPMALVFDHGKIETVRNIMVEIQLAVEFKLPFGKCDLDDVQKMRDVMNLAMTLIAAGHAVDIDDLAERYGARWEKGHEAFRTYYNKAWRKNVFTCTADELNGIRDGIEIAGAIIDEELQVEPFRVMKAFAVMKSMTNVRTGEGITFDPDQLRRTIDKAVVDETRFIQDGRKEQRAARLQGGAQ